MKKIVLITAFILFSFSLMANSSGGRNSLSFLGITTSNSSTKVSINGSSFESVPEFDIRASPSITFLRSLPSFNNKLSLGFDLAAYISEGINTNEMNIQAGGIISTNRVKANYDSLTTMFIADYNFLTLGLFDFSLQGGVGIASSILDLDYTKRIYDINQGLLSHKSVNDSDITSTYVSRIGLVSSYNFARFFALGLGLHYTYIGETKFRIDSTDYRIKNKGVTSFNVSLKWLF
ncbi:MAG: hypothetical protein LBH40_03690 [Alphaproteobacteria bacterium]|jgi:hypothetical protein|nr:hypothetical protein [Alphaproteobacteria bacterium]